jgi:hypothetical protein
MDYPVWLWSNLPDASIRIAPLKSLPRLPFLIDCTFTALGSPVLVPHPKLQDAKKLLGGNIPQILSSAQHQCLLGS